MFSTKTLCRMFFQTCLKGFKLKKLVVEPKKAQLVEPDKEPVDHQLNWSKGAKNILSLPEWLFNWMRNRSTHTSTGRGSVKVWLRSNGHLPSTKCQRLVNRSTPN